MSLLLMIVCCIWLEYAFIIYISLKVRSKSASLASAATSDVGAARAYETHRAVSRILAAHATLPLFMSLPVTLNISLSLCGFSIAHIVPYFHATLVWLEPIKSAVTICCVPAYRAAPATCRQTARLHHRRNPHFRPSIENVSCSYIICCRCFQSFAICDSFFTVAETILNKFVLNHLFNC